MSYQVTFFRKNDSNRYELLINNQIATYQDLNTAMNASETFWSNNHDGVKFEIIDTVTRDIIYGVPTNAWATSSGAAHKNKSADLYNEHIKAWR